MLQLSYDKVTSSSSEARSSPKLLHTKSFYSINSQNDIQNVMNSYCSTISECFSTFSDPHLLDTYIPVNESNIDSNTSTFSVSQLFDTSAKNIKHSDSVFENEIGSDSSIVIVSNSKLHDSSSNGDSQLLDLHIPVIEKDIHSDSVFENEIDSDSSIVIVSNSKLYDSSTNVDSQLFDLHISVIEKDIHSDSVFENEIDSDSSKVIDSSYIDSDSIFVNGIDSDSSTVNTSKLHDSSTHGDTHLFDTCVHVPVFENLNYYRYLDRL